MHYLYQNLEAVAIALLTKFDSKNSYIILWKYNRLVQIYQENETQLINKWISSNSKYYSLMYQTNEAQHILY